jgi:hypothetical protein
MTTFARAAPFVLLVMLLLGILVPDAMVWAAAHSDAHAGEATLLDFGSHHTFDMTRSLAG